MKSTEKLPEKYIKKIPRKYQESNGKVAERGQKVVAKYPNNTRKASGYIVGEYWESTKNHW